MDKELFEVESFQIFSESLIWQLNRNYYQNTGIDAWSSGTVPHQITSNSFVGRTYAALILGLLKDLAAKGAIEEIVYIVELGAGHGRLGFHILKHLEKLTDLLNIKLPPYCYVLTDIVEENLNFYKGHPQLQSYLNRGLLDFAYYDAIKGKNIHLRHADITINEEDLKQPLIAVGNYFFDSIPTDLFQIQGEEISLCSIALQSSQSSDTLVADLELKDLKLTYKTQVLIKPHYKSEISDTILNEYRSSLSDTYLIFPENGILCLHNLKSLSTKGLMLLSMDKGFHELDELDNRRKPEIISHGSFSLWVNYHALGRYCESTGGMSLFPSYSTFHLQVACLLFINNPSDYNNTNAAYQQSVNNFGPDDLNSIKKMSYANISDLSLMDLIALLRLSAYDSTYFINILPRIKKLIKRVSNIDRKRIAESLDMVWNYYFNINEKKDLALEIAGIFFDLGFYNKALIYFQYSANVNGIEMDTFYNKALCYYQLRQDTLFTKSLEEAKQLFPDTDLFDKLQNLDLSSE